MTASLAMLRRELGTLGRFAADFPALRRITLNPLKVYWIDAGAIRWRVRDGKALDFPPIRILDGDWDLSPTPYEESPYYKGMHDHFVSGIPWAETDLFKEVYASRLEESGWARSYRSMSDLLAYYETDVGRLYDEIRLSGVKPPSWLRAIEPLYVHVSRTGDPLWGSNGNHRLAIAKFLGLGVPVRIRCIHPACLRNGSFRLSAEGVLSGPR